jgi:hypothetical protein
LGYSKEFSKFSSFSVDVATNSKTFHEITG